MRPIIQHELMKELTADLHRQADRDRMARAASRTRHTQPDKRRPDFVLGRTATVLVRRVLSALGAEFWRDPCREDQTENAVTDTLRSHPVL